MAVETGWPENSDRSQRCGFWSFGKCNRWQMLMLHKTLFGAHNIPTRRKDTTANSSLLQAEEYCKYQKCYGNQSSNERSMPPPTPPPPVSTATAAATSCCNSYYHHQRLLPVQQQRQRQRQRQQRSGPGTSSSTCNNSNNNSNNGHKHVLEQLHNQCLLF